MKILIVTLFVFVCGFVSAQTGSFKCTVTFDYLPEDNVSVRLDSEKSSIFLWQGEKALELIFSSDSVPADTFWVNISDLYCLDTVLRDVVIKPGEKTELTVHIPSTCEYDKSKNDKTCPVCGKKDEVIPVEYGLMVYKNERARLKFEKNPTFYAAGCEITCCDPNWYCKRDKKLF